MTPAELAAAKALSPQYISYLPGSFEKRFARFVSAEAESNPEGELTENQRKFLTKMAWRYRKQLRSESYHWNLEGEAFLREQERKPEPGSVVLGGQNRQPRPDDAVLGGFTTSEPPR